MLRLVVATGTATVLTELVTDIQPLFVHLLVPVLLFVTFSLVVDAASKRLEDALNQMARRARWRDNRK